jgi:hypothetical protein
MSNPRPLVKQARMVRTDNGILAVIIPDVRAWTGSHLIPRRIIEAGVPVCRRRQALRIANAPPIWAPCS